jgi:salicylate hydroxylase
MSAAGRTVYIAGAGLAGLTLALALAKFGCSVVVLERSPRIQEYGAGLQISPNARRVLNQLGLDRQIAQASFEPTGLSVYPFASERPVTTLELGRVMRERFGAAYAVMHRADLAEVLYRACRRFANIDIIFSVAGFEATSGPKGVSTMVSGEVGPERRGRGFAFVGADGVNSRTRTQVLEGPAATRFRYAAWRTLIDMAALEASFPLDRTSLLLGPGFHAVLYPLPHRGKVNVALFARDPRHAANHAPSRPDLPALVTRSRHFAKILELAGDDWGYWPLATVATNIWHKGHIGLIGDAAHAMMPFQAQGAAMGIEDAAILAPLLVTEPSAESAFLRYAALRQPRVDRVVRLSIANGRAFHLSWPLSLARDAVIGAQGPRGHLDRLAWLYGYDTAPEAERFAAQRSA